MKYILLIFFFVLMISATSFSQTNSGVITYTITARYKKVDQYKLYFKNSSSILIANRGIKKSVIKIYDEKLKLDTFSVSDKEFEEALYAHKLITTYYIDEEGDVIYKNFETNSLIIRDINERNPILIEESQMPFQNWTLIDSSKKIGKFNCQKATTVFRGRIYEAWYTLEVPIANGPWKLHGLPGLILESQTRDKFFTCTFVSIEIPIKDETIIKPPMTGLKIGILDYQKQIEKSLDEKVRTSNTYQQSRGTNVTVSRKTLPYQELNYDDLK